MGDQLRVDSYDLTIVGIYRCGSLLLDVAIVADSTAVREIAKFDERLVTSIYFEPDGTISNDELITQIRTMFRGRGVGDWTPGALGTLMGGGPVDLLNAASKLLPRTTTDPASKEKPPSDSVDKKDASILQEEAVEIRSASDWGEKIQELSGDLDIFLWLMTGIGVVIALLSILNTMLMSVAERMIEFGVLRANGWSTWDVLRLITWESALLGLFGGASGCAAGWCAVQIVNLLFPTKVHLYASPGLLMFSLGFSTALGILGGVYPAFWAVRMSPMEAIRRG